MRKSAWFAAAILLTACTEQTEKHDQTTEVTTTRESRQTPAYNPATNVKEVAPTLYSLLSDTLGIRVMEATYKPGDSSGVHTHPDFAMYVLEGGTVRINGKDGSSQVVEFKKGTGMVLPSETHSARNIGKTTLRLVVVEVNRPAAD